jgi:hypothetical protein
LDDGRERTVDAPLLVVSLTIVRRHKPLAVAPLASSFAVSLVSTLLGVLAYPVAGIMAAHSGGVERLLVVQSALTVGFALIHMVAGVLLVLGLVKLATPDPAPVLGGR